MRQEEFKMERTGLVEIGAGDPDHRGKTAKLLLLHIGKSICDVCKLSCWKQDQIRRGKSCRCKRNGKGIFCNS